MPVRCVDRPNRSKPRFWTAAKVGKAACSAMRHGATRQAIDAEIDKCGLQQRQRREFDVLQALRVAQNALTDSNSIFDADADFLKRFVTSVVVSAIVLRLIGLIPRFGKPASLALTVLRQLASARLDKITVVKAANDAAITVVRNAAANEATFLRSVGGL